MLKYLQLFGLDNTIPRDGTLLTMIPEDDRLKFIPKFAITKKQITGPSYADKNFRHERVQIDLLKLTSVSTDKPEIEWCKKSPDAYHLLRHLLCNGAVPQPRKSFVHRFFRRSLFEPSLMTPKADASGQVARMLYSKNSDDFFTLKDGLFEIKLKDSENTNTQILADLIDQFNGINGTDKLIKTTEAVTGTYDAWKDFTSFLGKSTSVEYAQNMNIATRIENIKNIKNRRAYTTPPNAIEDGKKAINALDSVLELLNNANFAKKLYSGKKDWAVETHLSELASEIKLIQAIIAEPTMGLQFVLKTKPWKSKLSKHIDFILTASDAIKTRGTDYNHYAINLSKKEALELVNTMKGATAENALEVLCASPVFDSLGINFSGNDEVTQNEIITIAGALVKYAQDFDRDSSFYSLNKFVTKLSQLVAKNHIAGRLGHNLGAVHLLKHNFIESLRTAHRSLLRVPFIGAAACPALHSWIESKRIRYFKTDRTPKHCILETLSSSTIRGALRITKHKDMNYFSGKRKAKDVLVSFRTKITLPNGVKGWVYKTKRKFDAIKQSLFRSKIFKMILILSLIAGTLLHRYGIGTYWTMPIVNVLRASTDLLVVICVIDVAIDYTVFTILEKISPILKFIDMMLFRGATSILVRSVKQVCLKIMKGASQIASGLKAVCFHGLKKSCVLLSYKIRQKSEPVEINVGFLKTPESDFADALANPHIYKNGVQHEMAKNLHREFLTSDESRLNEVLKIIQKAKKPISPVLAIGIIQQSISVSSDKQGLLTENVNIETLPVFKNFDYNIRELAKQARASERFAKTSWSEVIEAFKYLEGELSRTFDLNNKFLGILKPNADTVNLLMDALATLKLTRAFMEKATSLGMQQNINDIAKQISVALMTAARHASLALDVARVNSLIETGSYINGSTALCMDMLPQFILTQPKSDDAKEMIKNLKTSKNLKSIPKRFSAFLSEFFAANGSVGLFLFSNLAFYSLNRIGATSLLNVISDVTELPMDAISGWVEEIFGFNLEGFLTSDSISKLFIDTIYLQTFLLRDIVIDGQNLFAALHTEQEPIDVEEFFHHLSKHAQGSGGHDHAATTNMVELRNWIKELVQPNPLVNMPSRDNQHPCSLLSNPTTRNVFTPELSVAV